VAELGDGLRFYFDLYSVLAIVLHIEYNKLCI